MNKNLSLKCDRPPKYCNFKKGRWVYRPFVDGKQQEIPLKLNRKLLREDCPCSTLHETIESLQSAPSHTLESLVKKYFKSDKYASLSKSSIANYQLYWKTLRGTKLKGGKLFGQVSYAAITPGAIRKYLDKRAAEGTPIAGNREVEFLSAVYSWAFERDLVKTNPCRGVRHNSEQARTRLINQDEYDALLNIVAGTVWYPACELAYLCRARRHEVFQLDLSDIRDNGVFIKRGKGSWNEITQWTPRLRAAIDEAIRQRDAVIQKLKSKGKVLPKTSALFLNAAGEWLEPQRKKNALDSAWQRIVAKLIANGTVTKDNTFTYHDIKAMGVTNHPLHDAGHKSEKAKAVYMRGTKEVIATE
ncbi:hypothetical protein [Thiomicrorhabdus sp.]|uniref:site-specific integrase n=1 Tax=Thiomicrorhabdus sp. TaxID=2039724 RepID=UPI0029C977B0|nr:hypothetical protein [Thiomicrorhabdus sp.]